MKKLTVLCLLVGILSGCYTQLITRKAETAPPVQSVSFEVDSLTGDTVKIVRQVDTVVERDNQHCYWIQNIWGEPELRCDNSYYSQSWYQYNNYPWWYDRYIYDPYYGSGYYSRGFYRPNFNRNGRYGGGSGRKVDTGNGNPRRTSSSAVPKDPAIHNSSENSSRNQGTIIIKSSDDASHSTVTIERRRRTSSSGTAKTITAAPAVPQMEQAPVTNTPMRTTSPEPPPPSPKVSVPPAPAGNSTPDNSTNRRKPARSW